jgi:glycosyltransferase involved in cell wall biosynthesis
MNEPPVPTAPGERSQAETLISICIPTYKRPDLLRAALDSCAAQTWTALEVVLGDDSPDDATEAMVAAFAEQHRERFPILYRHHRPSLGQNGNVNDLFARATGSRLLLLHDDDVLLPDAVERLAGLWALCPTLDAAFGKQLLIENDGSAVAAGRSEQLNEGYHRTAANAGRQPIPVVAGLRRMFPNDGFLVTSALARQIGYRSMEEVGHACDTDFGMRLCAAARDVWFLDAYTLKYRISTVAISKTSIVTPYTYDMLTALPVPPAAQPMLDAARREIAGSAISGFARLGKPRRAMELFLSPDFPMRQRLSPRGAYLLARIVRAALPF